VFKANTIPVEFPAYLESISYFTNVSRVTILTFIPLGSRHKENVHATEHVYLILPDSVTSSAVVIVKRSGHCSTGSGENLFSTTERTSAWRHVKNTKRARSVLSRFIRFSSMAGGGSRDGLLSIIVINVYTPVSER